MDVINILAKKLDETYAIVLVGTTPEIDRMLSRRIISIHKTDNQTQLAEIYSAADVFINPTREDNYPTVHMESVACGTPVISFDVGGCRESIPAGFGECVPCGDVKAMEAAIARWCNTDKEHMVNLDRIVGFELDEKECFRKYIDLYQVYST